MAKQWTISEISKAIAVGDKNGLKDICKRFPFLAVTIAKMLATDNEATEEFIRALPEYVTPLKMDRRLSGQADSDTESDSEDVEEATDEVAEAQEDENKEDRKRRIDRERQQRKREKDRAVKEAEEASEGEDEPTTGKYDEIGAVELFKICKKRGLTVQPKKAQRYYIDILEAADQEEAKKNEEPEEDEEDWGDDDEPKKEEKSSKTRKGSSAKKSSAKKPDPEPEDDEEDWNI